ncbi:hypothetical protein [Roseibium alexandrii]|uniref:hypothetical protein n=1 Tax=Roseibium alexandrii TaxID=388408 RepID=UPI003751E3E0
MLNSFLKALQARFAKLPVVFLATVFCSVSINAHAENLKPYKDRLFRYKKVTETLYDGDFTVVEYIKQRDLHGRDQIPERQVYGNYVSYKPKRSRGSGELKANGRTVSYMGDGQVEGRRQDDRHLYPWPGRKPLSGHERCVLWRQLQPDPEPDGPQRRSVSHG